MRREVGLQLLAMVLDEWLEWTDVAVCPSSVACLNRIVIYVCIHGILGLSLYFVCQLQDVMCAKGCVQLGIS